MPRLSLWRPVKGDDYRFTDRIVGEQFQVGGVDVFVHKYLEVIDQGDQEDLSQPSKAQSNSWNILTIQDMLFVENRNRLYDKNTFVMRGHFNEADKDFELLQFNLAVADGTKYITFPLNEMIDQIGRKLMAGDVLELPHVRDDALLDKDAKAINLWMVVQDASYPTEGYSPLWYPHLWRVKAKPLPDAPEYFDITRDSESAFEEVNDLVDLLTTHDRDLQLQDAVVEAAEVAVPERNVETRHFYVIPGDEFGTQFPWIFAGDGTPPNNAKRADAGTTFPTAPVELDFFLRTDYEPSQLFQFVNLRWTFIEIDYRKTYNKANRILETHINNETTFTEESNIIPEKQPISKAIKPRSDF